MTPRQNHFVAEYVIDHCGAAAAVRAGYAANSARQTASELLTNPNVRALVAEHEAAAAERLAVTRERVLAELEKAIDLAREQRNPAAMIAGWREVAKICGYYAPEKQRVELRLDGRDWERVLREMPDEDLQRLSG